jgi:hypothetical protein
MISLADLEPEKAAVLKRALSSVLGFHHTRRTFAQVIDGLPTCDTYESLSTLRDDIESRTEPSQDALALSRAFCDSEDTITSLALNPNVGFCYFPSSPRSNR